MRCNWVFLQSKLRKVIEGLRREGFSTLSVSLITRKSAKENQQIKAASS